MYLRLVDIHCPATPPTTPLWRIIYFYLLLATMIEPSMTGASPLVQRQLARFTSQTAIENLLVLSDKGRVVLGAVNHLYSLNSTSLQQLEDVEIGPVLDSPLCDSELASCIDNRASIREWDNHVKVLHFVGGGGVDSGDGAVLVCGSVRQGTCQLRALAALGRQVRHSNFPLHFRHQAVAANAPNASTVSMLSADRERLYVAASYAHDSPYRGDSFPAVATRLAPSGLLPINSGSIEGEAAVFIRAEYRQRFNVKYIGGFFDDKHVYWASVQLKYVQTPSPVTNPLLTKLIRVCKDDERYVSYSEIELQCRSADDNTNFNILRALKLHRGDVLIAVFTDVEGVNSAICLFSMAKVRTTYWYNIDRCRAGTDSIGLSHIGRDAKCINKSHLPLAEDTCQLGIGGSIEASQVAALQYTNKALTSVETAVVDQKDLVLVGTSQGSIIQFELTGEHKNRRLRKYADYSIADNAISRIQVVVERGGESFLAVADKELLLLRLSSCSRSSIEGLSRRGNDRGEMVTCESCTSVGDPLCGWCLERGSCTRRSECHSGALLLTERCPRLVGELEPRNVSVLAPAASRVLVPLKDLPPPNPSQNYDEQYECYFGLFKSPSAQWTSKGIQCQLPTQRPKIGMMQPTPPADSLQVPLTVRMARSRVNLLSQNFTFFDCNLHPVCSACTSSPWHCRWCAAEHKCLNPTEQEGRCNLQESQGTVVRCPRIDTDSTPEILIADSTNASLTFNVLNMNQPNASSALYCEVSATKAPVNNNSDRVKAIRTMAKLTSTNKVQCATAFYTSGENNNSIERGVATHTLSLINGMETIDEIPVTLYQCSHMAADCSKCLSLDPKWHCNWCDGGCKYHSRCSITPYADASSTTDQLCTQGVIESFYPKSAPSEGETLVEIRGRDLGSRLADVQDRVLVAGARCRVVDYEVSTRIRCVTEKAAVGSAGPIRVTIGKSGRRSVASKTHFRFVDPQPRSIYPQFGPQSGGTQLTIHGDNLNAGRNITVHLDNLPCEVRDGEGGESTGLVHASDQITCITSASPRTYSTTAIRIQIDGALRLLHGSKFTYRPDPSVSSIHPLTAYEGGGRVLTVSGSNFDSLLSAKIYLLSSGDTTHAEIVSQLGQCQIVNSTIMNCLSPKLTLHPPEKAEKTSYGRWPVGFVMDGVTQVRNLGRRLQLATVPNPQFQPFVGVKLQRIDQPLVIHGTHLSQAAGVDDYEVTIGTELCRVFVLDSTQLLCHPPAEREPSATDDNGVALPDGRPLVVVKVGGVRVELGLIELDGYAGSFVFGVRISLMKLALLVISSLSLLTFTLVVLFWLWRRRGSEHERVYKRIQLQMEQMESSVRNECKQAFAELQTDVMSDFNAIDDHLLSSAGIPFHERGEFIARLLFPRDGSHALYRNNAHSLLGNDSACGGSSGDGSHHYGSYGSSNNTQQMPMALAQFEQLLRSSQFVFLLVQLVEADEGIPLSERSSLASLLIAALCKDMAYLSEIVLALLSAHIERAVLNKSSHLLFRNSNSIVEKLFQLWFTICLHPYLVDPAGPGRQLYLLYRAIKSQVDRGPVDAVSGETRYSLSEQKLLRDSAVDAAPITLRVMPSEGFEQVPVLCHVLSCDTIGQVKAKLVDYYLCRNQPYSLRLRADQFDLEWRCPKRGSVLLMDDDRPAVKGMKRLNTVGHYQLGNNSLLAMQTRSSQTFTFRSGSSDTTCSAWSSAHLLDDSGSGSSPLGGGSNGYDTRYYHLSQAPPPSTHANGGVAPSGRKLHPYKKQQVSNGHAPSSSPPSTCVEVPAKTIPEVFLTRLLMCKGAIQRFIEAFFDSVTLTEPAATDPPLLCTGCEHATAPVPIVMKYVVDFLDAEAKRNAMVDRDVLHAWKTNAIILRFWMQLLHAPDTLLDVQRQRHLQPSLAVIGQTLVDTFSRSDLMLGKESPSSKLLFAKEISRYRPLAAQMYCRIAQHQPAIGQQQFLAYVSSISPNATTSCIGVSRAAAVSELLNWVKANGLSLVELLEQDPVAIKQRLGERLRQIVQCSLVESEHIYATLQ